MNTPSYNSSQNNNDYNANLTLIVKNTLIKWQQSKLWIALSEIIKTP